MSGRGHRGGRKPDRERVTPPWRAFQDVTAPATWGSRGTTSRRSALAASHATGRRKMPCGVCVACGTVSDLPPWAEGECFACATGFVRGSGDTREDPHPIAEDRDVTRCLDILDIFLDAQALVPYRVRATPPREDGGFRSIGEQSTNRELGLCANCGQSKGNTDQALCRWCQDVKNTGKKRRLRKYRASLYSCIVCRQPGHTLRECRDARATDFRKSRRALVAKLRSARYKAIGVCRNCGRPRGEFALCDRCHAREMGSKRARRQAGRQAAAEGRR